MTRDGKVSKSEFLAVDNPLDLLGNFVPPESNFQFLRITIHVLLMIWASSLIVISFDRHFLQLCLSIVQGEALGVAMGAAMGAMGGTVMHKNFRTQLLLCFALFHELFTVSLVFLYFIEALGQAGNWCKTQ